MTPVLKPPPRSPKPRKRIARSAPIARSTTRIPRGKSPRPQRKGKTAGLKRSAAYLWSRIVRHLADGKCESCGRPATDAAHVLCKSVHPSVRLLLLNGMALCRACHDRLRSARITGRSAMRRIFIAMRGRDLWALLVDRAAKPGPDPGEQRDALLMLAKVMRIR